MSGGAPIPVEPDGEPDVGRWGWYSIGINVLLGAINLVVALASGSLAVRAELIHNVVDLLTAVAVLVGLKLSTRRTKTFPYGLYKLENVISVVLGVMTFITAYEIARDALSGPVQVARVNGWMLGGVVVATIIPLVFSRFELQAGRRANSPALVADAKEYRAHVFTTGVVLAALLAQMVDFPIDRIAALVVVVAIVKTGWELLSEGMRVLLDASLEPEALLKMREIMEREPAVASVESVTGRNAGRYRFVEGEVTLRVQDLSKAEAATRRMEDAIRDAIGHVERVLIHAEPMERTHLLYAVPLSDPGGTISEHYGEAPHVALFRIRLANQSVVERRVLDNPFVEEERAKGIRVSEWLVEEKVDVLLLRAGIRGKGPEYVFRDAAIEVRQIECQRLEEAIDAVRRHPEVEGREQALSSVDAGREDDGDGR